MAQAFDPYGIQPDWAQQGSDQVTAWQQALAKLNYQKNSVLDRYGFTSEGNVTGSAQYNPDGTVKSATAAGGLTGVNDITGFVGKDNKTGYGGFRDELTSEANMMDAASNGPSRGFSGGLANQASSAAKAAAQRMQQGFTQGYNQFAAGVNQSGLEATNSVNTNLGSILQNQTNWGANEAAWRSTLPTVYTAGVSGGGSTPVSSPAVSMAKAFGYTVNPAQLAAQKAVTFKGTAPKPAPRGGHAL